ncbi:hypothetical protein MMC25_007547 [Agyrium rufum]|nr:hypothetical protein [Agyrium rufum]
MPLKLEEVALEGDFQSITEVTWAAYEDPPQGIFHLLYPIWGEGPQARAEGLKDAEQRVKEDYQYDPSSKWLKVIDTESHQTAAVALWHIYESNPFVDDPPESLVEVDWWPEEGDGRKFIAMIADQMVRPRMLNHRRPHILLELMATHPNHRRQGAADLLMKWGLKKADEIGVDILLEASEMGKPLYEKYGFEVIARVDPNTSIPNPSKEWKRLEDLVAPSHW